MSARAKAKTAPKAAEPPVSEVRPAPFQGRDREQFGIDLSRLLTGNLTTTDGDEYVSAERALLHVAAAQAKAILVASAVESIDEGGAGGAFGWGSDHKFTKADLEASLSGLVTLLQSGSRTLEYMRLTDLWRDSWSRKGGIEE